MSPVKKKKPTAPKPLGSVSHRFNLTTYDKAVKAGIDVSEVLRRALDKAVASISGECPTCGAKKS